jgi:hypothetical protein
MDEKTNSPSENPRTTKSLDILKIFNYIGGALIFFGIAYFIRSNWDILNNFLKLFSTLGSAIAAYIIGVLLHLSKKYQGSYAFFFLSALLLPLGLYVAVIVNQVPASAKIDMMVSFICLAVFLLSYIFYLRATVFVFFSIIFASLFFVSTVSFLIENGNRVFSKNLAEYEIMTLGISYIFLGYFLQANKQTALTEVLYFFGALFLLCGSYTLSGTASILGFDIFHWKIIPLIFIFIAFICSVFLQSKSFLYLASIFLFIYISEMSIQFALLLGDRFWALTLIIVGFLLMLMGYLIYYVNKKISRRRLNP